MLLCRPSEPQIETVNDIDGMIANFWRAVKTKPAEVAQHADWPVNELDMTARHCWLLNRKPEIASRLEADPDWCDAKAAGWWVWGINCWIGAGWCSGEGPWNVIEDAEGVRKLVHIGGPGRGVNRQLVHLGGPGRGVNRKRVHLGNPGRGAPGTGEYGLLAWMEALSERLARVRVCCGNWRRVCGPSVTWKYGMTGVFLDPPYSAESDRCERVYANEDTKVAHVVREWAIEQGERADMRVALCGYEGEHAMPDSWECVAWKQRVGYGAQGGSESRGEVNRARERVWFSPGCIKPDREPVLALDYGEGCET